MRTTILAIIVGMILVVVTAQQSTAAYGLESAAYFDITKNKNKP